MCLYTGEVGRLYDERFEIVYRRYYGGWSQFLAPVGWLYRAAYAVEEGIAARRADNCFVVAVIARKAISCAVEPC